MTKDEIIIQSIIDAAKKLMQQYGLNKTTMEDIAKEAGKGKSTLYHYFKSKEEIFDQVINQEIDDFFNTVKTTIEKENDAIEMLKTYIVTKINTLKGKVNLYRFAIETDFHTAKVNDMFQKLRNRYDKEDMYQISYILNTGIKSGLFKAEIQIEIEMLSELFVSCIRGIEMDIITNSKNKDLAEKADFLVEILIKGIGKTN